MIHLRTGFTLMLLALALPAQGIRWETDFDKAVARAKAEKRVIFVAINMDGERANDEAVRLHYRDRTITALSKHTVNLFASVVHHGSRCSRVAGLTCKQHQKIEIRVREKFLGIPAGEDVVAPQHLLISPAGKVLVSCIYQITVGELEWMFAEALKRNDPTFQHKPSGAARAPKRVKFGYERPAPPSAKPPTKEELEKVLEDLKKGRINFRNLRDKITIILRSPHEEAIKFVNGFIHSRWLRNRRVSMITNIGLLSPKVWYKVITPFLGDEDRNVRLATLISLERLASPKAHKELKKRWKGEKDPKLKGRVLRALAASKPGDKGTAKLIQTTAIKSKSADLRVSAVLALGRLADRKTITKVLLAALADPSTKVRSTAAYVIATRRDKILKVHLEELHKREQDKVVKGFMAAALKAIGGGKLEAFKDFLTKVAGDETVKEEKREGGGGPGNWGGGRRRDR